MNTPSETQLCAWFPCNFHLRPPYCCPAWWWTHPHNTVGLTWSHSRAVIGTLTKVTLASISGFHDQNIFTGWEDWPHAQPPTWRARDFLSGFLSLSHGFQSFKGIGDTFCRCHSATQCTYYQGGGVTYDLLVRAFWSHGRHFSAHGGFAVFLAAKPSVLLQNSGFGLKVTHAW